MLKTPDGGGGLDEAIARAALTVSAANRHRPRSQSARSEQLVRPAGARIMAVGGCNYRLQTGNIMEGSGRARPLSTYR